MDRSQDSSGPPSRLPLVVGLVLIALGWGAIYLGWQRAARLDLDTGQLPYLLSGGFGGLGLLLLGAAGVVIDVIQRSQWRSRASLEGLRSSIESLARSVESHDQEGDDDGAPAVHRRRRRPLRRR